MTHVLKPWGEFGFDSYLAAGMRAVAKERAEAEEKAIKESVEHVKRFGPDEVGWGHC